MALLASTVLQPGASDCEFLRDGLLAQPANTISSVAFVFAGIGIATLASHRDGWRTESRVFAACMIATGFGSVAYHGPQFQGAELVHDLSISFALALIAFHDLSLLVPHFRRVLFAFTSIAISLTAVALFAPVGASLATDILVPAIAVTEVLVYRRRLRPQSMQQQRRELLALSGLLLIAGALFLLGRTDSAACDPMSVLQPHAGWHVAAAGVFAVWWWLALAGNRVQGDVAVPTASSADSAEIEGSR